MLKILIYLFYAVIFTCCFYVLNKKLTSKWIMIGYPLFFCVSLLPIKLSYNAILPGMGKAVATEYLLIMLYAVTMITLFNFFYGFVNSMVNKLTGFQQTYGKPDEPHVKWYIFNSTNIKNLYYLFFYSGGLILYAVVVYQAKI